MRACFYGGLLLQILRGNWCFWWFYHLPKVSMKHCIFSFCYLIFLFLLTKSFLNDHFVDFISFYKEVKETLWCLRRFILFPSFTVILKFWLKVDKNVFNFPKLLSNIGLFTNILPMSAWDIKVALAGMVIERFKLLEKRVQKI